MPDDFTVRVIDVTPASGWCGEPAIHHDNPDVPECCKTPGNLIQTRPRADLTISTCRVCKRRHFCAFAEPAHVRLRLDQSKGAVEAACAAKEG